MTRLLMLLLPFCAAAMLRAEQTGSAQSSVPAAHWSDRVRREVLSNGLTILMLERGDLPIVSVQALYRVGSRNESPGLTGAAHYVEHMAFRATEGIAKADLTNQILRWGGRWNGYTSYDQTTYGSHAPSEHLEWLIHLERERMDRVIFAPDEVDRERTSVIAELRNYENSPAYVLVEHRLRRAALVAHPYGSPIMGWISDLQGVSAGELERFYRDHYAPNNLVLAIVGKFDSDRALAIVAREFGNARGNGRSTKLRTVEPPQAGERRVVLRGPGSRQHLEVAVHAPAASDTAFATLLALDGVMAGGRPPGRASAEPGSPLHAVLVESGAAVDVTTEVELTQYPGLYSIGVAASASADLRALEQSLLRTLETVTQTVTDEQVARAVGEVQAGLLFRADSNRAIANLLSVHEELASHQLAGQIEERLRRVTAEMVRAFARDRLAPARRTIGVFVPEDDTGAHDARGQDTPPVPDAPVGGPADSRSRRRAPAPKPAREPALPSPDLRTLSNGLTTVALRIPGEVAHVRIRLQAGAAADPPGGAGTAVLTARLLDAGSTGRRGGEIAALLRQAHVRLERSVDDLDSPGANRWFVDFGATLPTHSLPRALPLLAELLMTPAFPQDAVVAARSHLAGATAMRADDSDWRAQTAALSRLYATDHPYGRPAGGTPDSVGAIAKEDVTAFYSRFYRPPLAIVAIVGDLPPESIQAAVENAFGSWKPAGPDSGAQAGRPARAREGGRVHVSLPHKEQASIFVALPGPSRTDAEYPALAALNYLLGETGYAGRLGDALVDPGVSYSVYASVLGDREAGPIVISTNAARSQEAVDRIRAVLDSFAHQPVSAEEVREAQGFLLGRLLFRFETPAIATATLADHAYFKQPLADFARRVKSLTPEAVARVAARYYDPAGAVIAVAGR
ncbi:MAG: insulinase family protein [Acidobacteria bacterium]|nr:insulinase family protein [Acidobacteriota bacterium]